MISAFIAFSIRGRTALVAGFAGGVMADLGSSGVIGAVINGFIAGGVSLLVTNFASKFLRGHDAIVGLLLYPVTGSLFTSAIALFFTNIPAYPGVSNINSRCCRCYSWRYDVSRYGWPIQ